MSSYKHLPKNLQAVLRKHPTWGELCAKFVTYNAKGISMQEFCDIENLPLKEFSQFHKAVMEDIEKEISQDPFLSKITSLPHAEQNKFVAMQKKRRKAMQKLADAIGGAIGEKLEIKDVFSSDGVINHRVDRKLQKALTDFNSIDPIHTVNFMMSMHELSEIESEYDTFLSRHGL